MEILGCSSPVTTASLSSNLASYGGFSGKQNSFLVLGSSGYSALSLFSSQKTSLRLRKSVILAAKKDDKRSDKKPNTHSFIVKPDEAGFFPEAVLLKEKKVQEDGRLLPEFADDEERELFEQLNLELESALKLEQMRHYEVVYAIHEDHAKEVESVNLKVQVIVCIKAASYVSFFFLRHWTVKPIKHIFAEFIKEKKGRIWRFNDWGMRRLAYKIKKARNAHYILMNFELEAKSINDFKNMLDKDERVIRHLVIKKDKAETKECPPPPEFHTLLAGMDDDDDDDDDDAYDDEDDENDEEDDVDETYDDEDDENDEEDDDVDETYDDEDDDMDDTHEESVDEEEEEEEIDGDDNDIEGEKGIMNVEDYIEGYRESRKSSKLSESSRVGSKKLRPNKVGR
ncbi:hypothetical protein RHMOL_Rhmol04G0376900 [Rhododendron molle]|uniref:Uncharacterized protein n=1 Tax=Rhododendron molle TaxID=49168 RepID=A0ACC0P9Q9_RHOML|nr:hypothetical protein RHMOL_Rhmol04G0376900 [Rhododendron molle]